MKRRALLKRVVFCLILGAATTVAVAWGIGCCVMPGGLVRFYETPMVGGQPRHAAHARAFGVEGVTYSNRPAADVGFKWRDKRVLAWPVVRLSARDETIQAKAAGWPLRALSGYRTTRMSTAAITDHWVIDVGKGRGELIPRPVILLRPIPIGFVLDTVFYGAIWFVLFWLFVTTRRIIRQRRGRCVVCAYRLEGLASARCPECGAAIER